jgi:hypothetical protein
LLLPGCSGQSQGLGEVFCFGDAASLALNYLEIVRLQICRCYDSTLSLVVADISYYWKDDWTKILLILHIIGRTIGPKSFSIAPQAGKDESLCFEP